MNIDNFINNMNDLENRLNYNQELSTEEKIDCKIDNQKNTSIFNDLNFKKNLYNSQRRYDKMLSNSKENRMVKDFCNGNYSSAGKNICYLYNSSNGKNKYLYGYNFNHTLSPFYMNWLTNQNLAKVLAIMKKYYEEYNQNNLFFVTLTMPNVSCDINKIDDINKMLKYANNVINNLNKKIAKKYKVVGFVKKFECTFKTRIGINEAHPHYHLLVSFDNDAAIRIMKDSADQKSLSNEIFDYWFNNFILKYFKRDSEIDLEQFRKNCRAGYDFRKTKEEKLELELAGYIAKSTKKENHRQFDFLKNQEIFDFAYKLMHRKRLLTYVGCFKRINKEIKEEDVDITAANEADISDYTHKVSFSYNSKQKEYGIIHVKKIEDYDDLIDDFLLTVNPYKRS